MSADSQYADLELPPDAEGAEEASELRSRARDEAKHSPLHLPYSPILEPQERMDEAPGSRLAAYGEYEDLDWCESKSTHWSRLESWRDPKGCLVWDICVTHLIEDGMRC